jgi:hypothetical protein
MKQNSPWVILWLLFTILTSGPVFSQTERSSSPSADQLVGNVYGTVIDATTSKPIPNADVFLLDPFTRRGPTDQVIRTDKGTITLPPLQTAVRSGVTNQQGEFLINFVPTPFPFKLYTIVIRASGYNPCVIDQARVLPGATMSLKVTCRLTRITRGIQTAIFFKGDDPNAPLRYRHQEVVVKGVPKIRGLERKGLGYSIFATREGLVGGTTANGHVIKPRDHFVALPSYRALNANDRTYDFQVRVTYKGRSVIAPVWDVGPWNIFDDYWNPENIREIYKHMHHGGKPGLGTGVPQAQAAYLQGYNRGWSGDFGSNKDFQIVRNPAGIDLADGTFWDDLKMKDNDWVTAEFLWRPGVAVGNQIQTTTGLNVRSTPAGTRIGQVPKGARGTIIGGPEGASYLGTFYVWWKIRWNDSLTGWSVENWLTTYQPIVSRQIFDFNQDNQTDILWQLPDGRIYVWFMKGTTQNGGSYLNLAPFDSSWKIVATGDFNQDGQVDLIGQNKKGLLYLWFMKGILGSSGRYLNTSPTDSNWQIVATGDFNGDGQTDILWQHKDGWLYVWFMKGILQNGGTYLNPNRNDPSWKMVGIGDFNQDNSPDILWQRSDGRLYLWLMKGTTLQKGVYPSPSSLDPNWKVIGIGDFNQDGQSDLLWEDKNGRLAIWLMNGTTLNRSIYPSPSSVNPTWRAIGPK